MVPYSAKVAGVGCCGFACVVDGLEKVTPKRNGNCWYLCLCEISGL